MGKTKLDLSSLEVETFAVDDTSTEFGTTVRGGVKGQSYDNPTGLVLCTWGCTIDELSCGFTCNNAYTCHNTERWTVCQPGCAGYSDSTHLNP